MSYRRPTTYVDGKQRLVSRLTMERHLGRPLLSSEIVHHIDHDPFNNAIENLQIVTRAEHKRIHGEIGQATRLAKRWKLEPKAVADRLRVDPAHVIAGEIGCSEKTVVRAAKAVLPAGTNLRTFRSARPHPAPNKQGR